MINHGISTGALFLLVGIIYERRHTRMIADYGGLAKQMPMYATLFLIIALSSMGLPALNGFIGEFTILQGGVRASASGGRSSPPSASCSAPRICCGSTSACSSASSTIPANANLADVTASASADPHARSSR